MTDADFLESWRATRDRAVLDGLFARHYPTVYHVVLKMVRNATDANDVTQSAFLKALEAAGTVRPGGSLRNWLLAIAVNEVRQFRRSAARRNRPEHLQELSRRSEPVRGQEGELQRREFEAHLEQTLQHFPDDLKDPLVLHYYQNLSYSEMADVLAIPKSTVQVRMDRALETLREQFKKRGVLALFAPFLPSRPVLLGLTAMKLKIVATALVILCCLLPFGALVWRSHRASRPDAPETPAAAAANRSKGTLPGAASAAIADGPAIFGRVLEKGTDAPIAGALVAVYNVEEKTTDQSVTDEKGVFRVASTRGSRAIHQLKITAPGHAALSAASLEASTTARTWHLSAGGTIVGRVEDANGVAIHPFSLSVVRNPTEGSGYDPVESLYQRALPQEWILEEGMTTIHSDGRFEMRHVTPGSMTLAVMTEGHPPFFAPARYSAGIEHPLQVQEGKTTELRIVRPAPATIRVRVTDTETLRPLAGARVAALADAGRHAFDFPQKEGVTDESGLCTIVAFLSSYGGLDSTCLTVGKPGYSTRRLSFGGQEDGYLCEVALGKTASLRGRVQAPDGTPVHRAAIYVERDSDGTVAARVFTDASGAYSVEPLDAPGEYQVHVFDRALKDAGSMAAIVLREGESRELNFGVPGQSSIAGTVAWKGTPVRGASVCADPEKGLYHRLYVYTNSRGEFRLDGVNPGSYELTVHLKAPAPEARIIRPVTVKAGECAEVRINAGGFRIRGTVSDAATLQPVPEDGYVELVARRIDGDPKESWEASVNPDGSFELSVDHPGVYQVSTLDSYDWFSDGPPLRADLTAQSSVEDLRILLHRDTHDRAAVIRLVDAATGEAVSLGSYAYRSGNVSGGGDFEEGAIQHTDIFVGRYTYKVTTEGYVPVSVPVEVTPGSRRVEKTVALQKSDAVLVGPVLPSSAADKAGLRQGDVILSYDGHPVLNTAALTARLGQVVPTQKVAVEVRRDGETQVLLVPGGALGMEVENTIRRIH